MLLGNPAIDAQAAVSVQVHARDGRSFVLESRPTFVMLPTQGFSVAVGSPYDIVFYDKRYYLNQDGSWYRSSSYRGPWTFVKTKHLPSRIRKHRLEEIRSFRDTEYRRHDQKNNLELQRSNENNRRVLEQQRSDENNQRVLQQQRSDENNQRVLQQQRSDENNRRALEQQRNDENNRRTLEQQRNDQNRK